MFILVLNWLKAKLNLVCCSPQSSTFGHIEEMMSYEFSFLFQFARSSRVTGPSWDVSSCLWCAGGCSAPSPPPAGPEAWEPCICHGFPRTPCLHRGSAAADVPGSQSGARTQLSLETWAETTDDMKALHLLQLHGRANAASSHWRVSICVQITFRFPLRSYHSFCCVYQ